MITIETWAHIRHLHFQVGLGVSAIAKELQLDRKTVRNAIRSDDFIQKKHNKHTRPSKLDPFKGEITRIVEMTPRLSGVRILEKLRKRGYEGGKTILNKYLATLPQRRGEVYLRIETGPGEQAQCDWGKCGTVKLDTTTRTLSCFVMTLGFSRFIYVHFYLSETMECFLDGHLRAFSAFGGIPHTIVYDNLKSVVLGRYGSILHFNPAFMDFAGHHLFKPEPCRPRKPEHKGKVERGVGYVKNNFLAGREHLLEKPFDLALINHQCSKWLAEKNQRIHGSTHKRPTDLLALEMPQLLPLPSHSYDRALPKTVHADRQAFVCFQTNLYSVPPEAAGKLLTLKATPDQIEIYHQKEHLASHKRSFEKYLVFENPDHRQKMLRHRRKARQHKQVEFFAALDPVAEKFLQGLTHTGAKIPYHVDRTLQMVDIYGKTEVLSAIARACEFGAYHFEYVENIIQERRRAAETSAQQKPPLPPGTRRGHQIRLREIDMSQYRIKKDDEDA